MLCSCDDLIIDVHPSEHVFGEWATLYEPTCTTDGERERTCKLCNEAESEKIAKKGHIEGDFTVVKPATCTEQGYKAKKCKICNETIDFENISALGHSETVDSAAAPTCTESGLTEGSHCSVCNEIIVAQESIPALGHKMSEWNLINPSDDVNDRFFESVCQACEYTEKIDLNEKLSSLTYVSFGDSITYGIDGVDWGLMEDPYPELVSRMLGFKKFTNLAVSGATYCENKLGRTNMTKKILSFNGEADVISLMLGVNDCYVGLPLGTPESRDNTTIYGSLFLISEYLTANYEDAFIFYMTPFPYRTCYTNNNAGYKLEDVADAIKYVAEIYNIPVLDMYLYSEYENVEMHRGDGLHPSQSFMRDYTAPKIVSFIKENYGN